MLVSRVAEFTPSSAPCDEGSSRVNGLLGWDLRSLFGVLIGNNGKENGNYYLRLRFRGLEFRVILDPCLDASNPEQISGWVEPFSRCGLGLARGFLCLLR